MEKLRWGIIGTGAIAGDFATALRDSTKCEVVSAAGSSPEKSRAFAERFGLPRSAESIGALLADRAVDAVYIATPHPMHEAHALLAIDAGRAVLCEKPLTVDAAGAERVIGAARRKGVFLMEAFMYRCHPLVAEVADKLRQGAVGTVRHIRADFGFFAERRPEHRLFNPELAGGAILDIGCYPASFARLVAGLAVGIPFDEPAEVCATGQHGPTGVDELALAQLRFDSGVTAQLACSIHHDLGTGAWVFGDEGVLHIPDPWLPLGDRHGRTTRYRLTTHGRPEQWFEVAAPLATYAIEAELVASMPPGTTEAPWPAMGWGDTLGNMRLLDRWREQVGVASTVPV